MSGHAVRAIAVAMLVGACASLTVFDGPAQAQQVPAIVDIRGAAQAGSDRIVFEFQGGLPERIDVQLVDVVVSDPVGWVVPVAGQARLRVAFGSIDWFHAPPGGPHPTVNVIETVLADSFEGLVHYAIGMRTNAAFRVSTASAPPRVIIDVDHAPLPTVKPRAGSMYGVDEAGQLRWYRHADAEHGNFVWAEANFGAVIGTGWGSLSRLVAGGGGILYGIDAAGDLRWYRHDDVVGGANRWTVPNFGNVVGNGWGSLLHVVADGFGAVYAVRSGGDLLWFDHIGRDGGHYTWGSGSGTVIGSGFDACEQLFAGGPGILYCVRANGDLQWWRHIGSAERPDRWKGGDIVGTGWNTLSKVWSGGNGVIYGVDGAGTLRWYRHLGSETGTADWEVTNFGAVVGSGWNTLPTVVTGGLYAVANASSN